MYVRMVTCWEEWNVRGLMLCGFWVTRRFFKIGMQFVSKIRFKSGYFVDKSEADPNTNWALSFWNGPQYMDCTVRSVYYEYRRNHKLCRRET